MGSQIYLALVMLADPAFQAGQGMAFDNVAVATSPVPEPTTTSLLVAGATLVATKRRRRSI